MAKASIYVSTPTHGDMVTVGYHRSIIALITHNSATIELESANHEAGDLVRSRSRSVHKFLTASDADYMLFVDSDIEFEPEVIEAMLAEKKDMIGCPYPKKLVHWDVVEQAVRHGLPARLGAYEFVLRMVVPRSAEDIDGLSLPVEGLGLGLLLVSRDALALMDDHYSRSPGLVFKDDGNGEALTTALFSLMVDPERKLLSEDFSFCERYRKIGGQVWCYLGKGSPVKHTGSHVHEALSAGIFLHGNHMTDIAEMFRKENSNGVRDQAHGS
jgi:hypothetical protein